MDEKKLKKLATTEQVENVRVQLLREVLYIRGELDLLTKREQRRYESANEELDYLQKSRSKIKAFCIGLYISVILICLQMLYIFYQLHQITDKLTALGL